MTILDTLLEITIYSAILLGVIYLFRLLLKNQISPTMKYMAWFLLVARLLIPVTVNSGFSFVVIPPAQTAVQGESMAMTEPLEGIGDTVFIGEQTATAENNVQDIQPLIPSEQPLVVSNTSVTTQTNDQFDIKWETVLIGLWLVGIATMLIQLGVSTLKLKKRLSNAVRIPLEWQRIADEIKNEIHLKHRIRIVMLKGFPSPALSAGLRPVVVLPEELLDKSDEDVRFALLHELTHIKRGDHAVSLLLILLRAVYWFNPVAWLLLRYMRFDMETACDSRLTQPMNSMDRKSYAVTMLSMYASEQVRYVLGMALEQTKKTAEKRVRGIFMRRRSSRWSKATAVLLTCLLLIVCFTTACQPTPEEDIVIGKGDGLSDLIESPPDASSGASPNGTTQPNGALNTTLDAPEHWLLETTALEEKLNITADVDIEMPGVSQPPSATASLSEFKQEDLDKIANVLGVGDADWKDIPNYMTKEVIGEYLIGLKAELEQLKAGDSSQNAERIKEKEKWIKYHEQEFIDAPDEIVVEDTEFKIHVLETFEEGQLIGFKGITQVDNEPFYLSAFNDYNSDVVNVVCANPGSSQVSFGGIDVDAPYGVSLTKEQAAKQASDIAAQLTDELSLCYIAPAGTMNTETSRSWGWACVFMREVNGCPTAYDTIDNGISTEAVSKPSHYEKMIIVMDDMGMLSFRWEGPMKIKSIDNPAVPLLSFDEISQQAIKHISYGFAGIVSENIKNGTDRSDPGRTANIENVKLGLMRVNKKDSTDFYYIPVWKFFVATLHTDQYFEKMGSSPQSDVSLVDKNGKPVMTIPNYSSLNDVLIINALDGSVVDNGFMDYAVAGEQ